MRLALANENASRSDMSKLLAQALRVRTHFVTLSFFPLPQGPPISDGGHLMSLGPRGRGHAAETPDDLQWTSHTHKKLTFI